MATQLAYIQQLVHNVRGAIKIFRDNKTQAMLIAPANVQQTDEQMEIGLLPPLYPEWLGDPSFLQIHGVRFPYVVGAMANGIATVDMVIAAAKAGLLGFFGAAGLSVDKVNQALIQIKATLDQTPYAWGANLIHMPDDPQAEEKVVDLYLKHNVKRVSASAFMSLTPSLVHYACSGLTQDAQGHILRKNFVFAKISQPYVATLFLSPPPQSLLDSLVAQGKLSMQEAKLARYLPIAEDITVESDSGGHTDNRPLGALFPTILNLKQQLQTQYQYSRPIRVGAAGGMGTPKALAAAFAMGASYVLTGSINQATIESGLSLAGKQLLAQADIVDMMMAPAADMFERGVKVQVLKRSTMFGPRAQKLYDIYTKYQGLQQLPQAVIDKLEQHIFRDSLSNIWQQTQTFFSQTNPTLLVRAHQDDKLQMALIFRWYLGKASRWAISGESTRQNDYQIWCGPAMGAFNRWVANSPLASLEKRSVAQLAYNLLEGAAVILRAQQLRHAGIALPDQVFAIKPQLFS